MRVGTPKEAPQCAFFAMTSLSNILIFLADYFSERQRRRERKQRQRATKREQRKQERAYRQSHDRTRADRRAQAQTRIERDHVSVRCRDAVDSDRCALRHRRSRSAERHLQRRSNGGAFIFNEHDVHHMEEHDNRCSRQQRHLADGSSSGGVRCRRDVAGRHKQHPGCTAATHCANEWRWWSQFKWKSRQPAIKLR